MSSYIRRAVPIENRPECIITAAINSQAIFAF